MSPRVVCIPLLALCARGYGQDDLPGWLTDARAFCTELSYRTNGKDSPVPFGRPKATRFADYPVRPIAPQRRSPAILGKYDRIDEAPFAREVKSEAAKGPDFAGRHAIMEWSCGTWCANSIIADVLSGKMYGTPFLGVAGCRGVTGDFPTLQRRADSSLLIVRGSLEMTFDHSFSEGPCGTFYFRWNAGRLRLIGCDIPEQSRDRR